MALANGGTVQREHTCLVDSTSSCPGLIEINQRTWRLDLPPSANLLLYGPSFMSEIVSSIVAPNAEELTPNITSAVSYVQEQRLGQAASASWAGCNVPGGDATCRLRGACRDGVCTYTFRNGARLTAVTNAEELQDPGSQASRDAFAELLRANSFSHVFFMMPHGQEYWVESAAAALRRSRRNDPAKINDALGRNMCLPSVAGTVATWDEYSACISESVYWQAAHRLLRSDRLTLVVPWMQAVPSDSRLSGHAVLSTARTAIGRGCGICDPARSAGCPTPTPIFGHLLHQCVVVCERGGALNASLATRRPNGPCLAGTVPVMAEQLLAAAYPEMARDPPPARRTRASSSAAPTRATASRAAAATSLSAPFFAPQQQAQQAQQAENYYTQPDADPQGPSCREQWLRGVEYLEQQRIDVAKPEFAWPSDRYGKWQEKVYGLSGVQAVGREPSGRRVLFIHIGKAGGSSTAKFLVAAKIASDQVHCNAVLPEVVLAPSFTQTLVVVRDPIARLSSAFDYSVRGTVQDPEQFRRLGECFALVPTLDALVELYTRETEGECWSLARDLLVLHEKPAGHMQFNACWYLGGIVDQLENVFVAQQETLDGDLEAFRITYFDNATDIEGPSPSVGCEKCAPEAHANISEASLRALSVILRTEYDAVNAVMALSQNKRGVSYAPPF